MTALTPMNQTRKEAYMVDSEGRKSEYKEGDRVFVHPLKMEATVIKQRLHYDGPEAFWGNLELLYDDGSKGISNSWQCSKVIR